VFFFLRAVFLGDDFEEPFFLAEAEVFFLAITFFTVFFVLDAFFFVAIGCPFKI